MNSLQRDEIQNIKISVEKFKQMSKNFQFIPKYANRREIDEDRLYRYLNTLSSRYDEDLVQSIVNETSYANWDDFIFLLNCAYLQFLADLDRDKKYCLYLKNSRIDSMWLCSLLMFSDNPFCSFNTSLEFLELSFASSCKISDCEKSRNHPQIEEIVNHKDRFKKETNIIIIDDCVYTGNNVLSVIDAMSYNNKGIKINFYIIIPFISVFGLDAIRKFKEDIDKNEHDQILTLNIYKAIDLNQGPHLTEKQQDKFKLANDHHIPIFFDHDLGNEFATYSTIYKEILNYLPDKSWKEKIQLLL